MERFLFFYVRQTLVCRFNLSSNSGSTTNESLSYIQMRRNYERRNEVSTGSGSDRVSPGFSTSQFTPHLHRRHTARRARAVPRNRSKSHAQFQKRVGRKSAGARL